MSWRNLLTTMTVQMRNPKSRQRGTRRRAECGSLNEVKSGRGSGTARRIIAHACGKAPVEDGASGKPYPVAGTDGMDYDCASPETVFSTDSQWVYFVSDRDGKPALYRMQVEDLVEAT